MHAIMAMATLPAGQLSAAFSRHMEAYGRLDVCINSAGIPEIQNFMDDRMTDGSGAWRRILDINLTALVDSTRLAVSPTHARTHAHVQTDKCTRNKTCAHSHILICQLT